MVEQFVVVIKAKQQRANSLLAFIVAKPANHAVDRAEVLDLLHAEAISRFVRQIATLGDDAIERRSNLRKPFFRVSDISGCWREPDRLVPTEIFAGKALK